MTNIFEYVTASAARNAERPAIFSDGVQWSYAELCTEAENIAAILNNSALKPGGKMIAIAASHTISTYAGLLGILASGNAYVPLNLQWPDKRILEVCKRVKISALVIDKSLAKRYEDIIETFANGHKVIKLSCNNLLISIFADWTEMELSQHHGGPNYAYVIFTSGSSGVPKGVPVTHKNVICCIEGTSSKYPLEREDHYAQMADLSFDVSVADMFLCWRAGACLYVPTSAQKLSPGNFISKNAITVWSSVPSVIRILRHLSSLNRNAFPNLRLSLFCGEALPSNLADQWQQAASNSMIVNLYGPTEASIFATSYECNKSISAGQTVPIGKGLPGMCSRVEDSDGYSNRGELLLAGPQIVTGYWDDPISTQKVFIRDKDGGIWYRTGDLVEIDNAHCLHFLGRIDSQIKCRGFRIDTEEVAGVVAKITSSDFVVVIPVKDRDGLCDCLVAFTDNPVPDEAFARASCGKELPGYMVPRKIISLRNFPLSVNGKVDRQQLALLAEKTVYDLKI